MRAPIPCVRYAWLRTRGLRLVFFFAYAMLALTVVEQGRIIQAQQTLIRQLYPDSAEWARVRLNQH